MKQPKPKWYSLTVSNGHCIIDEQTFVNQKGAKDYWVQEYDQPERKSLHANIRFKNQIVATSTFGKASFKKV